MQGNPPQVAQWKQHSVKGPGRGVSLSVCYEFWEEPLEMPAATLPVSPL
jgi:hypothetical protein